MKKTSLLVVVAGAMMLGACGGMPEESEELVPVPQESEVSAMYCAEYSMGSSTSCKSQATWKSYASDSCAANGLTLSAYTVSTSCGDGMYRYVKYTCCP